MPPLTDYASFPTIAAAHPQLGATSTMAVTESKHGTTSFWQASWCEPSFSPPPCPLPSASPFLPRLPCDAADAATPYATATTMEITRTPTATRPTHAWGGLGQGTTRTSRPQLIQHVAVASTIVAWKRELQVEAGQAEPLLGCLLSRFHLQFVYFFAEMFFVYW
jgi:hypothetical protein